MNIIELIQSDEVQEALNEGDVVVIARDDSCVEMCSWLYLDEEGVLAGEMVIEAALCDACPLADFRHAGCVVPVCCEAFLRGGQYPVARLHSSLRCHELSILSRPTGR